MSLVGANNFAMLYNGRPKKFRKDVWIPSYVKIRKSYPDIDVVFMGSTSSRDVGEEFKVLSEKYLDIGFFPDCIDKVDTSNTLFVNAWDPLTFAGNGNKNDASLDGYIGRVTGISHLCSPYTNKNLNDPGNYIMVKGEEFSPQKVTITGTLLDKRTDGDVCVFTMSKTGLKVDVAVTASIIKPQLPTPFFNRMALDPGFVSISPLKIPTPSSQVKLPSHGPPPSYDQLPSHKPDPFFNRLALDPGIAPQSPRFVMPQPKSTPLNPDHPPLGKVSIVIMREYLFSSKYRTITKNEPTFWDISLNDDNTFRISQEDKSLDVWEDNLGLSPVLITNSVHKNQKWNFVSLGSNKYYILTMDNKYQLILKGKKIVFDATTTEYHENAVFHINRM
jgi:hypothetical protein